MGPISLLLNIYIFILLAYVIFSWVPRPPEPIMPFVLGIRKLVEPLLRPLRKVIPSVPLGGIRLDLSIIVLFIGTRILISIFMRMGL